MGELAVVPPVPAARGRDADPNCATFAASLPPCSRGMATIRLKLRPNAMFPLTVVLGGTRGGTSMTLGYQAPHQDEPALSVSPLFDSISSSRPQAKLSLELLS